MKSILITIPGQRNLIYHYQGKWFDPWKYKNQLPETEAKAFQYRNWTQTLWKNFAQEEANLRLNIIDTFLKEKNREIDTIIFFTSNQISEPTEQHTDTLYAGKIIKALVEKQYPSIEVTLIETSCAVVDNNELIKIYRNHLKELQKQYPQKPLIIADMGGTGQQKTALKLMIEYLYDPDQFESFYLSHKKGKSQIIQAEAVEYRKVINAEQILSLIKNFEYGGAFRVLGKPDPEEPLLQLVWQLLHFAAYRKDQLYEVAARFTRIPQHLILRDIETSRLNFLENYRKKKPDSGFPEWAKGIFTHQDYFRLFEILLLVQKYHEMGDWSKAVLNLHRFVENYTSFCIQTYERQHPADYETKANAAVRELTQILRSRSRNSRPYRKGKSVPFYVKIAAQIEPHNQVHQQFIREFAQTNSLINWPAFRRKKVLALDTLRNSIAHEGKGIDEKTFNRIFQINQFIPLWIQRMGISESPYDQLHTLIEDLLKREEII